MTNNWHRSKRPAGTRAWQRLRHLILTRDQGICHVCGQPGADEVDHVVPLGQGGTDDPRNLAAIHSRPCHTSKTGREAATARHALPKVLLQRDRERHPGLRE